MQRLQLVQITSMAAGLTCTALFRDAHAFVRYRTDEMSADVLVSLEASGTLK
jgi:hypothetical protein